MTNTVADYWSADGVSLQTLAHNIETLGGRLTPPKMRGDDTTIPYVTGQRFETKTADSRIIPLAMWVRGYDDNGNPSSTPDRAFDDNWRALRNLLWDPRRQFVLQKRFYVNGALKSASTKAQFNDGLEPSMIGRNGAKFTVDLKLTDPYFYDDNYTTVNLVNGNNTVTLPGDVDTEAILITINGSRNDTKIHSNTLGMQVEYNDSLTSGSVVIIDVKDKSSITTPSGVAPYVSNGKLLHAGAPEYLRLKPGDNTIVLSSTSGTGLVQLQAKGAWI